MRVSFLGLGLMGYPMAGHLVRHFETLVWNRSPAKAEAHALEHGSKAVQNVSDAVGVDVVFSCVPTSNEVKPLVQEALEVIKPGLIWVDCTSGDPASARELAATLAARGAHFLDAPVSGGVAGAVNGKLTVMVGGDPDVLERAQPLIGAFAAKVVHVGPSGAGMAVKAANQALLGINILALSEVLLGLEKAGVRTRTALEVINASSGRSNVSMNLFPERVVGRAFPATFALGLMAKDVRIASQALREARVPSPLTSLAENLLEIALRELGSEVDHVAAAQLLERWAGQELGHELGYESGAEQ
jgi:3-hydroxyisobutyrate dehydrogenase